MKKPAVKNQVGSSRMDTVLKMLLIAFISLLAFSSGVYFGKQLSDSDYQLKALESDFSKGGEQASKEDGAEGATEAKNEKAEGGIKEEDVAALAEKAVASEKGEAAESAKGEGTKGETAKAEEGKGEEAHHGAIARSEAAADKNQAKKAEAHAAHAETPKRTVAAVGAAAARPDLTAATKAAQRVANNASPIDNPKAPVESRVPSSLPKTVGASQDVEFTVQVASYPTAEAAKDHANELVKKGFPAFPVEATVNGKTWYRVSVGSFRTLKEATVFRSQLLKQTSVASAIVQRIQR